MPVAWKDYVAVDSPRAACTQCRQHSEPVFAPQRAQILRVLDAIRPNVVACLGAGGLNDIPYTRLVEAGTKLHPVDWVPNMTETAVVGRTNPISKILCLRPPRGPLRVRFLDRKENDVDSATLTSA